MKPDSLHDKLVLRACRWLKARPDFSYGCLRVERCRPVFSEMVTSAGTSPDAIGWFLGQSRLVEVKTSRSDFFAERKKLSSVLPDYAMGRKRWYLVPEGLLKPEELPPEWGLLYAVGRSIREIVPAPERLLSPQAQEQETLMLTSAISRLLLGSRFYEKTGRWETFLDREKRQQQESKSGNGEPGPEHGPDPGRGDGGDVPGDGGTGGID